MKKKKTMTKKNRMIPIKAETTEKMNVVCNNGLTYRANLEDVEVGDVVLVGRKYDRFGPTTERISPSVVAKRVTVLGFSSGDCERESVIRIFRYLRKT